MDKVYVGNLPPDVRIKDIDDFFRPFGNLVHIDLNHRANPAYALAQFDSPRNAFMAVKSRNGYNYKGYTLQLRLAESEVMKRRDATPPPPPPMFGNYGMQSNRGGGSGSKYNFNNNRMGQNYNSSSASSSFQPSQWGSFDNYNSNTRSNAPQYSSGNRVNIGQHNMMDYSSNNRSNLLQSSSGRSNMSNQSMNFSNTNQSLNNRLNTSYSYSNDRSNMPQQNMMNYSSNNRSNMSYSSNDRSIMPQQNMNYSSNNRSNISYSSSDRSNMYQPNMNYSNNRSNMPYSSNDRSIMPEKTMNFSDVDRPNMDYANNSNWGNNGLGISGNFGGNNFAYNANDRESYANDRDSHPKADRDSYANAGRDSYAKTGRDSYASANRDSYDSAGIEENFTRGLSGAGRKWFNRYVREGYTPEEARAKALERRTVPYMRNDPKPRPIVDDPTNAALENIGTTIMSLLSSTAVDNFNSGNQLMPFGGENFDTPSSSRGEPRNAVSRQQYLKSLKILKELRGKGPRNAKDRLSKKYHTQIVNDYERYEKQSRGTRDKRNTTSSSSEGKSYTQLLVAFKKKKQHLLVSARRMGTDRNTRSSGAFRKRMRILITEGGFPEIEAKALAVHPINQLRVLMSMKADCDAALEKKQVTLNPLKSSSNRKSTYDDDVKYLKIHERYRVENLSSRIKTALRTCVNRVHKYERERNLPLTKTKFARLLASSAGEKPRSQRRRRGRRTNRAKKVTKQEGNEKDKAEVTEENANDDEEHCDDTVEEQQECGDDENIDEEQHDENYGDGENTEQKD